MPRNWTPHRSLQQAEEFRRAETARDREPVGHYERGGFGYRDGYHGAYAERPRYRARRERLYPPEPEGSGWPHPLHSLSGEAEARHLRALRDRELARSVDMALYNTLGRHADRVAVYADDAVVTLAGRGIHPDAVRPAIETACDVPGVRRVRNRLVPRWH